MTTRAERAERAHQKQLHQLELANLFASHVVAPVAMDAMDGTTKVNFTKREVRDLCGRDGVRCFTLMFKRLTRGGRTRAGETFKSTWVVNRSASCPYLEWWTEGDGTLPDLHARLRASGATEEQWFKPTKQWLPVAIVKVQTARQREARKKSRKYVESVPARTPDERAQHEAGM